MDIRKIRHLFGKFQNIIKDEISLMDDRGYVIYSSNLDRVGEYDTSFNYEETNNGIISINNKLYYSIHTNYSNNLIISIEGNKPENKRLLQVIALFLSENLNKLTKEDFIKAIILKELSDDDIKELSSKFDLKFDSQTKAIVIKLSEETIDEAYSVITNMYPDEILIRLSNNTLTFIKIINNNKDYDDLEQSIYDTIFSELLYEPNIGVGIIAHNLSELYESYEKANLLIKLGSKFAEDTKIYHYNDLLLPMLIDNVEESRLKDIMNCANSNVESILLDKELFLTGTKFLENNLNISDTARKLYVHRNTLIYRLNKIQNITGLDLRNLNDAIKFNILMLGLKFLQNE
ncbi:helix-turn-helix domain-containing protein [Wukongibacter baidiensis]|uniref:PucR family transcriptional regulator n=1 Tax=Wukongibacter baidiensis TaxID=1723361 RepID=UPI003D7FF717